MITMQLSTLPLALVVALFSHYLPAGCTTNFTAMELETVQVLFRHGERAPQKYEYNLLNYIDLSAYEPYGLEQLTNNGKMQAYQIGKMLKERYKNFLNETYNLKDVYARSSENERTRLTLQLVLAGLYPPSKELRWHPTLDWLPIAYRYVPAELDSLFKTQLTNKFRKLEDSVWNTSWGLENLAQYKDIFKLLDKNGIKIIQNEIIDLGAIHNILHIHELMGLPLPEWYTENIKLRLKKSMELYQDSQSHTQELKKINGGPLIKTFIKNMNLDRSTANPPKLYLYSGHDLNVAAVIRALNLDGFRYSDFCTTLILETWRDSKNQVYVRLLHWNAIEEKLSTTRIGNCEEFCPIDDFLKLTRDVIPSDEELFSMYDQYDFDYVKKFFP